MPSTPMLWLLAPEESQDCSFFESAPIHRTDVSLPQSSQDPATPQRPTRRRQQDTVVDTDSSRPMTGPEAVEVLTDDRTQRFTEMAQACRLRMNLANPVFLAALDHLGLPETIMMQAEAAEGIRFATGESDHEGEGETIRDYTSGPEYVKWQILKPYWYKIEVNQKGLKYRRHMNPDLISTGATKAVTFIYASADPVWQAKVTLSEDQRVSASGVLVPQGCDGPTHAEAITNPRTQIARSRWQEKVRLNEEAAAQATSRDFNMKDRMAAWWCEAADATARSPEGMLHLIRQLMELAMTPNEVGKPRPACCATCFRALTAGPAHKVRPPRESLEVCEFCNEWMHTECKTEHYEFHTVQMLERGLKRAESKRVNSDLLIKALVARPDKETEDIASYNPANALDDMLTYPPRLNKKDLAQRRRPLRTDTSDEEGRAPADYCIACGSHSCFAEPHECRTKLWPYILPKALYHMILTMNREILEKHYKDEKNPACRHHETVDEHFHQLRHTLDGMNRRVYERMQAKQATQEARRKRQGYTSLSEFLDQEQMREDAPEDQRLIQWLRDKHNSRELTATVKDLVLLSRATRSTDRATIDLIEKNLTASLGYKTNSTTEILCRTVAMDDLKKGMSLCSFKSRAKRAQAKRRVESFLLRVPAGVVRGDAGAWPIATAMAILDAYPSTTKEVAEFQGETDLDPASESDIENVQGDRSLTQEIAKRRWKDYKVQLIINRRERAGVTIDIHRVLKERTHIPKESRTAQQRTDSPVRSNSTAAAAAAATSTQGTAVVLAAEELEKALSQETGTVKWQSLQDAKKIATLYPPGSWLCSSCYKIVQPENVHCNGFIRSTTNSKRWTYCRGTQHTTWGGEVVSPEGKGRVFAPKEVRYGATSEEGPTLRVVRKPKIKPQQLILETDSEEIRLTKIKENAENRARHEKHARQRHDKRKRARASKASDCKEEIWMDPLSWICNREECRASCKDNKGLDRYNSSFVKRCFKCVRIRVDEPRWYCVPCNVERRSIPESETKCDVCNAPRTADSPVYKPPQMRTDEEMEEYAADQARFKSQRATGHAESQDSSSNASWIKVSEDEDMTDVDDASSVASSAGGISVACSIASSIASMGAMRRRGRRGGKKVQTERSHRTSQPPTVPEETQENEADYEESHAAELAEHDVEGPPAAGSGSRTHARRPSMLMFGLLAAAAFPEAEANVGTIFMMGAAAISTTHYASWSAYTGARLEQASDEIVGAASYWLGTHAVPVFVACIIAVLLAITYYTVQRIRTSIPKSPVADSRQEMAKALGQVPVLWWLTRDTVAKSVTNYPEARDMVEDGRFLERVAPSRDRLSWTCRSQTDKNTLYELHVRPEIAHTRPEADGNLPFRRFATCSCRGYHKAAESREFDYTKARVCKHLGALFLLWLSVKQDEADAARMAALEREHDKCSRQAYIARLWRRRLPPTGSSAGSDSASTQSGPQDPPLKALKDKPDNPNEPTTYRAAHDAATCRRSPKDCPFKHESRQAKLVKRPKPEIELPPGQPCEPLEPRSSLWTKLGFSPSPPAPFCSQKLVTPPSRPRLVTPPDVSIQPSLGSRKVRLPSGITKDPTLVHQVTNFMTKEERPKYSVTGWSSFLDDYDIAADNAVQPWPHKEGGCGTVLCKCGAKQAHKLTVYLAEQATSETVIWLLAAWFDCQDMTKAFIAAKKRGATVHLIMDKQATCSGAEDQRDRALDLDEAGIDVRVAKGLSAPEEFREAGKRDQGPGILHAKVFVIASHMEIEGNDSCAHAPTHRTEFLEVSGSSNWTTSSRRHREIDNVIALNENGFRDFMKHWQYVADAADVFSESFLQEIEQKRRIRKGRGVASTDSTAEQDPPSRSRSSSRRSRSGSVARMRTF